jgi:hypothetical protein
MESPAIIVGVVLARRYATETAEAIDWRELLREAFFNGSVFVLIGSLIIGAITGASGEAALAPFTGGIFKGVLCLFLLDMGLVSARRLVASRELRGSHIAFAAVAPLVHAALGIALSLMLGIIARRCAALFDFVRERFLYSGAGCDAAGGATGEPGHLPADGAGITFPFNVIIGLPLYLAVINRLWS